MGIKDIFSGNSEMDFEDDYLELDFDLQESSDNKILILIENLGSYADSDRIQRKVREGNIVMVKIKDLKGKDIGELKRSIGRIRKTCMALGGDIAGISDEWVVACPNFAKIHREKRELPQTSNIKKQEE